MVLVEKWPFFLLLFLGNIGQENVFDFILKQKNAFLSHKKKKFKKWKNCHFPKRVNPWFWSKNGHLSTFFFSGNIGKNNIFYDILDWQNAFQGYKNKKSKKSKNWHFSKGVNPWFSSNFSFLGNIGQENIFYDILERKNAFLGYKKKKFKKSKNWRFSKGVITHGFGPKMAIFPTFFFWKYRPEKCLLRYSKVKKRLSRV